MGGSLPTPAINAKRSVYEMQMLSARSGDIVTLLHPMLAVYDGPLLGFFMGKEVLNAAELTSNYHEAMSQLQDVGADFSRLRGSPLKALLLSSVMIYLDDARCGTRLRAVICKRLVP
jgi:hypothetical protein